jgi:hypothetical protein
MKLKGERRMNNVVTLSYSGSAYNKVKIPTVKAIVGWFSIYKKESYDEEIATPYLLDSLRKSEEDKKAGRVIAFDTNKKAIDYLDAMIINDK